MSEPVVLIARLHGAELCHVDFMSSWIGMQKPPKWIDYKIVRVPTHTARNTVINLVLRTNDAEHNVNAADPSLDLIKEATHIFYMDDDMTFPKDALMQLLADDVPIVSGMYVKRFPPFWPVPMRRVTKQGYTSVLEYCDGLQEVDVVGGGCLLIKREVLEAITYPWFDYLSPKHRGKPVTEDVPFCEKVKAAGIPILVDFDVKCGHLTLGQAVWDHWLDFKEGGLDLHPTDPAQKKIMRVARKIKPYKRPEPAAQATIEEVA